VTPDSTENPLENSKITSAAAERQSSGWDIRNAPKNYLSLVITQAGSALFSFGCAWLITRYFGAEGYGGIVAVLAASQVAQVFVNWTSYAVIRFGVDEFVETEKIARTFWIRFLVLVFNSALVLSLSGLWFAPLSDWLKISPEAFWLVIGHFIVTALWVHVQMGLQAVKMPRFQGFLTMVERLLILAALAALLIAGRLDFYSAVACYIAAPLLMALVGFGALRNFVFARFAADREFFRKVFAYSVPLLPFSLVGYFSGSYVDAIFVSKFLSTSDLGVYTVATQINGIALQLPTVANSLLIPLFVTLQKEDRSDRMNRFFRNMLPSLTLGWGFLCTAGALFFYFAIPVVFGSEFAGSVAPLWILLAATTVGIPVLLGYSALSNATSTTYISMFASIFGGIANVVFNLLLIPKFGLEGCAWATVAVYCVSVAIFAVLLKRSRGLQVSWVFLSMIPAIAGAAAYSLTKNPWWSFTICVVLVFLVAYQKRASLRDSLDLLKIVRAH
jgi:O-antigen/teichoic acid export membrane protein